MCTNNPIAIRRHRLEAQLVENNSEQADLRHKLLFSKYPHHQTPEGQKTISDLLDGSIRVGRQIRAALHELDLDEEPEHVGSERLAQIQQYGRRA